MYCAHTSSGLCMCMNTHVYITGWDLHEAEHRSFFWGLSGLTQTQRPFLTPIEGVNSLSRDKTTVLPESTARTAIPGAGVGGGGGATCGSYFISRKQNQLRQHPCLLSREHPQIQDPLAGSISIFPSPFQMKKGRQEDRQESWLLWQQVNEMPQLMQWLVRARVR